MPDALSMNISNIHVPKDILKRFEDLCNKIQKGKLLFEIKQLPNWSITKENKDVLATEKLVSDLRGVFRFKELQGLYIRFPIEQLKNSDDPTAKQLLSIKSTIEGVSITSESGSPEKLSIEKFVKLPSSTVPESEQPKSEQPENEQSKKSNTIEFSKKEKDRVQAACKNVEKLVNNYNSKNKKGQSRTLVYKKACTDKDISPEESEAIAIIFHLFSYFRGCKSSTKIIKKYNEINNFTEKYNMTISTNIPDDKTKKNLMIPMPKGFKNTTYLEDLRIILERNKKQYEETLDLVKKLEKKVRRDNADSSIDIRDAIRTVDKFIDILENFVIELKKFIAENHKYSKFLKKKAKGIMNLYESSAKIRIYLDSYKEIKFGINFGDQRKDLLFLDNEVDTYRKHINNLIITATKAKSIKKIANCVNVLNEDYRDCAVLRTKIRKVRQEKARDMTYDEAVKFGRKAKTLAVQASEAIGPLQNGMYKLQKILKKQKDNDSIPNKIWKVILILGGVAGAVSSSTAVLKNLSLL